MIENEKNKDKKHTIIQAQANATERIPISKRAKMIASKNFGVCSKQKRSWLACYAKRFRFC